MAEQDRKVAGSADRGVIDRVLDQVLGRVERIGNRLPHPFMLFVYLAVLIAIASAVLAWAGADFVDPETGDLTDVRTLLSTEGLRYVLTDTIPNFVDFPPLGVVLGIMLGIGLAQRTGLLETAIRHTIMRAPRALLTYVVMLVGVLGNLASDAAFVIIPPLAAFVFHRVGRHPLAGLAAGFAAVGAGFTANVVIAGTDALLAGITTETAQTVSEGFVVTPADNYYFMVVAAIVLPVLGVFVTERVVEPRLGTYTGDAADTHSEAHQEITSEQRAGLKAAAITALVFVIALAASAAPPGSPLRDDEGSLVPSPLLDGVVPIVLLFFVAVSVAYGIRAGTITRTRDVPVHMTEAMKAMSGFIVLIFAAAQFIAYFEWTNMAGWVAVSGAGLLEAANLAGPITLVGFVLLAALLNLAVFSGSAQWALMAPVFVPLFMLLGYHPGFVQVAFRIADSSTNIITPMNPYILIVLAFMKEYDEEAGLGTLISTMLPYSIAFFTGFALLLTGFAVFDLPVGPGVTMRLE
jgi:aminobenzoyl-glutamate transport protein